MNVPRKFKLVLGCVVGVSLAAFGVAEENLVLGGAILIAAWAGWWCTEWTGRARGLPRWATNFILVGVLIGALVRAGQGEAMVSAFNGFLASLVAVKLWERREIRDYAQVLTLSLFLAVGATLNHNSLGVGLALILLVPLLAYSSMAFQVIAGEARHGRRVASPVAGGFGLGGLAVNASVVTVGISVVVFLMIPRGVSPPAGMSSFGRLLAGRVTGMSDRVRLGQGGLISESQAVALHVRMTDGNGQLIGGEGQVQYFRGSVLDDYRDGTWSRSDLGTLSEVSASSRDGVVVNVMDVPDLPGSAKVNQYFDLRGVVANDAQLFALYRPGALQESLPREGEAESGPSIVRYRFDRVTGWVSRSGPPGQLSYAVTSVPGARERGAVSRRGVVSFPSEKLAELARRVLKEASIEPEARLRPPEDDVLAARTLESYLRGACSYTLDIRASPRGVDPTEWFVFTEKRGHCEYFASALAGMCRAVGIDARVITGYVASQFDSTIESYVVRASNAHAWTEVNVSPGMWRTFDATPPEDFNRQHGAPQGWLMRLSRLLGDVEDVWSSRVVSFDQSTQARMFGRHARSLMSEDFAAKLRAWANWREGRESPVTARGAAGGLLAVLALGGMVFGVVVFIRRVRRARAAEAAIAPSVRRLREDILRACVVAGLPRPVHVPLRRHVEAVARRRPEMSGDLLAAADVVYAVCFGGAEPDAVVVAGLREALRGYRRRG